jgi:hypothetical protein
MANHISIYAAKGKPSTAIPLGQVSLATNTFLAYPLRTPLLLDGRTYITTVEVLPSGLNQVSTFLQSTLTVTALTLLSNA